ncbi:alpha/beta hydrolase family protein [Streptomyces sp. NPDC002990]
MNQVRSLWWACRVPGLKEPFDTAQLRVCYPARATGSDTERLTGVVAADAGRGPFPVVVLLPGINVPADSYRWLAVLLAGRGFVAVTPQLVGELFAGSHGVTPGIDLEACPPGAYGTRATTPLIGAVLTALTELAAASSPLAGLLDTGRVVVGGHSAGGTVALQSAAHVPGLRGVFTYGAHTLVAAALGHPPGTVLPVAAGVPVLLMSGEHDGVIAASADRYGATAGPAEGADPATTDPVARTFHRALPDADGAHAWVKLAGAGHFTFCDPVDPTSARAFLEPPQAAGSAARALIGRLATAFCAATLPERPSPADTAAYGALLTPPHPGLVSVVRR